MGGFGSGDWADVMTRKVNTGLCRTLSVKTLKMMGVFDDDPSDEVFSIRWVNEFGEDGGMVTITPHVSGSVCLRPKGLSQTAGRSGTSVRRTWERSLDR